MGGIYTYNEMLRCAVAHAGNDHRLGAQEAPPAIFSLYPGTGFEQHVDNIIAGGPLNVFTAEKKMQPTGCKASMAVESNVEDRNRTAPFPFCGNRYEFRAVGSSQNCSFPIMICNTIMAAGMSALADEIEKGTNARDAIAAMYKKNRQVIFTGNGYSQEWPKQAAQRGLANLKTTPMAIKTWSSAKNVDILKKLNVLTEEETKARTEVMYEAYNTTLIVEVKTLIQIIETGILPACMKDLAAYGQSKLAGGRAKLYESIAAEAEKLKQLLAKVPSEMQKEAEFLCGTVKPQMDAVRRLVDEAEGLMEKSLYPYPTSESMLYHHHH